MRTFFVYLTVIFKVFQQIDCHSECRQYYVLIKQKPDGSYEIFSKENVNWSKVRYANNTPGGYEFPTSKECVVDLTCDSIKAENCDLPKTNTKHESTTPPTNAGLRIQTWTEKSTTISTNITESTLPTTDTSTKITTVKPPTTNKDIIAKTTGSSRLSKEKQSKEIDPIVWLASVAAIVGTAGLVYAASQKIITIMQSGTYRMP